MMKRLTLLLITLLINAGLVLSQSSEFSNGYIITCTGDSIPGEVKDRQYGFNDELIKKLTIRTDNGKKKRFKKKNVLAYQWGGEVFERRKLSETVPILKFEVSSEYFLVQIEEGSVELYKHYYNDFDNHSIDYVFFIKDRVTSSYQRLPVIGFKSMLRKYFLGKSDILKKLENGRFRYADIPALVREGNLELR